MLLPHRCLQSALYCENNSFKSVILHMQKEPPAEEGLGSGYTSQLFGSTCKIPAETNFKQEEEKSVSLQMKLFQTIVVYAAYFTAVSIIFFKSFCWTEVYFVRLLILSVSDFDDSAYGFQSQGGLKVTCALLRATISRVILVARTGHWAPIPVNSNKIRELGDKISETQNLQLKGNVLWFVWILIWYRSTDIQYNVLYYVTPYNLIRYLFVT